MTKVSVHCGSAGQATTTPRTRTERLEGSPRSRTFVGVIRLPSNRAMASQELQDLGHFVAIGHTDPVAATERNASRRLSQVLAHSVAA